jgi:hypothetical protein
MSTPRPWKPFTHWQLSPPHPGGLEAFTELVSRQQIWRELLQLADIRKIGRTLFSGTAAQKNARWGQFGSFIRQAKAYDDAAAQVKGLSAALLQYYAALNLAKAELLAQAYPQAPYKHGLRYSSTRARSIAGDFLTVEAGVFPLLYAKRTGVTLPVGTRLNIKRLLANVPELGWELRVSGFTTPTATRLIHAAVHAGGVGWALIGVDNPSAILSSRSSSREFTAAFEQVSPAPIVPLPGAAIPGRFPPPVPPPNLEWRDVFAISRRFGYAAQWFFESRWQVPLQPIGPAGPWDFTPVSAKTNVSLKSFIDLPSEEGSDATLVPSLLNSRMLPMPSSLARYALIFYLSSLVRYRPTQVDLATNPAQHWLMSAFADQAALHMLQSMLSGITGRWHLYYSPGTFRV